LLSNEMQCSGTQHNPSTKQRLPEQYFLLKSSVVQKNKMFHFSPSHTKRKEGNRTEFSKQIFGIERQKKKSPRCETTSSGPSARRALLFI